MTTLGRLLLSLTALNLILFWTCISANPVRSPARVLIIQERSVEDGYMVEIEANGETRNLQLSPLDSVWSEFAQALHFGTNENGEKIFERKDIPKEFKVYHDAERGAIVTLKDGKVNGILDSEFMIRSEGDNHFVMKSIFDEKDIYDHDYIIAKELPFKTHSTEENTEDFIDSDSLSRQSTIYTVEVAVIIDSRLASLLGTDTEIFEYLTIFWNGVNSRFERIESPKIVIRLVGCVIMRNDEPFISDNIVQNDYLSKSGALYEGAEWINQNLDTLPEHDVMYIQTGLDLINSQGSTSVAGVAFMNGACRKTGNFLINNEVKTLSVAVGLGEDMNGGFSGVHTASHEIAHNIGAPHDADENSGTGDCPWDDGYIMSYVGGSINRLYFSQCSKDKMAEYLATSVASCTRSNLSQTKPAGVFTSNKLPGEVISMTEQCKAISQDENAYVYDGGSTESELCYHLKCRIDTTNGYTLVYTNRPSLEGSVCPSGKRCYGGECV